MIVLLEAVVCANVNASHNASPHAENLRLVVGSALAEKGTPGSGDSAGVTADPFARFAYDTAIVGAAPAGEVPTMSRVKCPKPKRRGLPPPIARVCKVGRMAVPFASRPVSDTWGANMSVQLITLLPFRSA